MVEKNDLEKQKLSYEEEFSWAERMAIWYEQADDPEGEPFADYFRRCHKDERLLLPLQEKIKSLVAEELPSILAQASDDVCGFNVDGEWFQLKVNFRSKLEEAEITKKLNQIS